MLLDSIRKEVISVLSNRYQMTVGEVVAAMRDRGLVISLAAADLLLGRLRANCRVEYGPHVLYLCVGEGYFDIY